MDPLANIAEQRAVARKILALADSDPDEIDVTQAERLAELVTALDEWRQGGGFDPYAAEVDPEQPKLQVEVTTNVYALSEHGFDGLPWPVFADAWLWKADDTWIAHVGAWYVRDWWADADPADIATRPQEWNRHILDVPTTGTLHYLNAAGELQVVNTGRPTPRQKD